MTIRLEKLKARLLANPEVKVEYDALGPQFEIATEHEDAPTLHRSEPTAARKA